MKLCTFLTLLILLPANFVCATAGEFHVLEGHYSLSTSNMVDAKPEAKADRVLLFVEGNAAKEMYDSINQKPTKDQCATDVHSKKAGNLICSKIDTGNYFCTFGVSLKDGKNASWTCMLGLV